jgi:rare lipoprotein A
MNRIAAVSLLLFVAYGCATHTAMKQPASPGAGEPLHGVASWYGQEFAGRTTANGEIFDPMLLTAAHRTLPFGTVLDVKNPKTGQTVRVRVNDRGPFVGNRLIDLSYAAAQRIGLIDDGSGDVDLLVVTLGNDREPPAPYVVEIKEPKEKIAVDGTEAPKVDFPLPTAGGTTTTIVPTPAPPKAVVDQVIVVEELHGAETRKQVSPDGRKVETVEVKPNGATAPITPTRDTASAPGHESSAALDRAEHRNIVSSQTPQPKTATAPAPRPVKSGAFTVQVGAFSIEANAKVLQQRLVKLGETSYIDRTSLWRVRMGPFATREQAIKARERLEAAGLSAIIVTD